MRLGGEGRGIGGEGMGKEGRGGDGSGVEWRRRGGEGEGWGGVGRGGVVKLSFNFSRKPEGSRIIKASIL